MSTLRIGSIALLALVLAACAPPSQQEPRVRGIVDADGFFTTTEAPDGDFHAEIHPGPNVRCLLRCGPGAPDEGLLVGRLAQIGHPGTCYVRRDGGAFEPFRLDLRPGPSQRARLLAALRPDPVSAPPGAGPVAAEFAAILRRLRPAAPGVVQDWTPPSDPPPHADAPLPGAPLRTWVRPDHVFARFRSVEAMYRFAGLADDVAAALLLRAGDARDHRTQWRGLYDLVLPTVWRTNPDAEKGVGEVALLVPRPGGPGGFGALAGRGQPAAALLLRIIRADLHESQTRAGIALGYREDHLRRPVDDPFPEEQSPAGARRTLGDVEVVATGEHVLRAVLAGGVGSDETRRACDAALRAADADPPPGNRAFFAFVPPEAGAHWRSPAARDLEAQARSLRQTLGLRALAEHMTGLAADPAELTAVEPAPPLPADLGDVVWADAHTDARGATVRIETRTADSARRIAAALSAPPPDAAGSATMCGRNLADLLPVARVERRVPDLAERCFVWLGWSPVCPGGGTYRAHPITAEPSCSRHGGLGALREAGPAPAAPVSEVTRAGSRVTFRLAIDWSRRQ